MMARRKKYFKLTIKLIACFFEVVIKLKQLPMRIFPIMLRNNCC